MDFTRKISFLVFLLCVLISLKNQNAEINKSASSASYSSSSSSTASYSSSSSSEEIVAEKIKYEEEEEEEEEEVEAAAVVEEFRSLQYDYYHLICPKAEHIIRATLLHLFELRSDVASALLRLVFHDCFVEGCDGSVLLDATDEMESEKDSPPNQSLKAFDIVDIIKSELEKECPGIVSCADLLVLAARESVVLAGGPFYPLHTGRRDGILAYPEIATYELPSPQDDLSRTISSFSSRGFDEREMVALLGAHSTGTIHCKFFLNRLNNFRGTDEPDPTLDVAFMNFLRSRCNSSQSLATSPSSSPISPSASALASLLLSPSPSLNSPANVSASTQDAGMKMDYEGPGRGFGTLYYRSLLQGKGLLYVDQQLTAGEETETWVKAYAYDVNLFQKDFALAMMKLSDYRVLTAPMGQVRKSCRKVNAAT